MLFEIKESLVNWVDGMKTNKEHLVQMENYFIDTLRDSSNMRLTSYNYGLLPPGPNKKGMTNFTISEHLNSRVEIELRACNAITIGGCRINFNPTDASSYLKIDYSFHEDLEKEKKVEDDSSVLWDIFLCVNLFDRVPTGIPDPDETPLRHPNAKPKYELIVKKTGAMNMAEVGLNQLLIGRVVKNGDRFDVDKSFIPPCTSMISTDDLSDYYETFGKQLSEIEMSAYKIIQKINDRTNNSSIANNVKLVSEDLMKYIAQIYFSYRNKGRFMAPIEVIDIFSSLAHIILISINFIPKKEREEMLQYFYEWSEVTPGNFTDLLSAMSEITYDHNKIRKMMNLTDHFLNMFAQLWIKLSTLEYIGQHKENIVVAEKKQIIETTQKSEWTILD